MCIAILKYSGVNLPTIEIMKNCFMNNPHGVGFVLHRNNENIVKKGFMKFDDFLKELKKINPKQSEQMMIHFRVASVGSIKKSNCHPYIVTDNYNEMGYTNIVTQKCVAVHNGTFKSFKNNSSDVSDTMQFIKMISNVINKLNKINDYNFDKSFKEFLNCYVNDNNSRFAFMNTYGSIYKFGKWIKDEKSGLYFSNESYLKVSNRFSHEQLELNF